MSERAPRIEFRGASAKSSSAGIFVDCRIANVGRGPAQNISGFIVIEGVSYPAESPIPLMPSGGGQPEQRIRFPISRSIDIRREVPPFKLTVEWSDESGRQFKDFRYPPV